MKDKIDIIKGCPVEILQEEQEFRWLMDYYINLRPVSVLEIGSFYGGTLWHWLNFSDNLKTIVSIDTPIPPSDDRYFKMIESKKLWSDWILNSTVNSCQFISGNSRDNRNVQKAKEFSPYDFIFIDGGHDYESVKSDYENYSPLIAKEGIIAFHDIYYSEDVSRYFYQINIDKNYEVSKESENGFGIGLIFAD